MKSNPNLGVGSRVRIQGLISSYVSCPESSVEVGSSRSWCQILSRVSRLGPESRVESRSRVIVARVESYVECREGVLVWVSGLSSGVGNQVLV